MNILKLDAKKISYLLKFIVYLAASLVILSLVFIVGYILFKGLPFLDFKLFEWEYNSNNVSMTPAIINTILMMILSLLIVIPIGVGASIYLVEYAKKGNKLVAIIRLATETLSGIPSIIYGLFGSLFFVKFLSLGLSLIAGAITLSIIVLPLIIRTTEEALLSVSSAYREGSFALGAGKLRTIFKVVLPSAIPGIFSGVILAIGRIMGESAALIFTAGTVAKAASSIFDSTRTLAVHMYVISTEGLYINQAYATAVILLIVVLVMNLLSELIVKKIRGKNNG